MSKSHQTDQNQQDDLDAALDNFIKTKKVQPAVGPSPSTPIDLFGGGDEKKKPLLYRFLISLRNLLGMKPPVSVQ